MAREFVLADIPGLIEGAHEGIGLGDRFLGHVERTRVLLHLVSAQEDDVAKAYKTVRKRTEAYGEGLADKPEIVALSQVDTARRRDAQEEAGRAEKGLRPRGVTSISGGNPAKNMDLVAARHDWRSSRSPRTEDARSADDDRWQN